MAVGSSPYPIVKVIRIWWACKRAPCVSEVVKRAVAAESERKCFLYHVEGARRAMDFGIVPSLQNKWLLLLWFLRTQTNIVPLKRKLTFFCRIAYGNSFCTYCRCKEGDSRWNMKLPLPYRYCGWVSKSQNAKTWAKPIDPRQSSVVRSIQGSSFVSFVLF